MISIESAIDALYRTAVTEGKATSTTRLETLADYCVQELARRGLQGVEKEASIPGAGRDKKWDVAWRYDGKYRLGISLKSLLRNLGGTVPNRIDDLIGEVANASFIRQKLLSATSWYSTSPKTPSLRSMAPHGPISFEIACSHYRADDPPRGRRERWRIPFLLRWTSAPGRRYWQFPNH